MSVKLEVSKEVLKRKLLALMTKEPISLSHLSILTGVDFTTLHRIVHKKGGISLQNALRLSKFFAVRVEWLATNEPATLPNEKIIEAQLCPSHVHVMPTKVKQ